MEEKSKNINNDEIVDMAEGTYSGPYYHPAVDIYEDEEALNILVDMPGVAEDQVDIDLREGILTIIGKTQQPTIEGSALINEFELGNYLRRFTLTDRIDQEKISAAMKHGVLRVSLPKAEKHKPRKIEVRAE